jgi:hypothetical protein
MNSLKHRKQELSCLIGFFNLRGYIIIYFIISQEISFQGSRSIHRGTSRFHSQDISSLPKRKLSGSNPMSWKTSWKYEFEDPSPFLPPEGFVSRILHDSVRYHVLQFRTNGLRCSWTCSIDNNLFQDCDTVGVYKSARSMEVRIMVPATWR